MSHHPDIDFHGVWTNQPGWSRKAVNRGGVLIGYLDRHEVGDSVEWLVCDPRWNSVGEHRYDDREAAVDALVAHAEATS